jgi:hypothetical protein
MSGRRRVWKTEAVAPKSPERIELPPFQIRSRAEVAAARGVHETWPQVPSFQDAETPSELELQASADPVPPPVEIVLSYEAAPEPEPIAKPEPASEPVPQSPKLPEPDPLVPAAEPKLQPKRGHRVGK